MLGTLTRATLAMTMLCAVAACSREEAVDSEPLVADSVTLDAVETQLATWDARLDQDAADAGGFQMAEQPDGGWTVNTGPNGAAIAWRDQDMVHGGAFQVRSTMQERSAPADHREGYGLFVGGRNLQQPDQQYTYFLVRGNGDFLVKRREGDATPTLVDWTARPSINRVTGTGDAPSNTLEIRADPEVTRFFVNDLEVASLPTEQVQPYGIAGMRVNHALDLAVPSFEVTAAGLRPIGPTPTPETDTQPADSAAANR